MLKNNQSKNQVDLNKNGSAKSRIVFILELVLIGLIVAGLAFAAVNTFKISNNKQPLDTHVSTPQPTLAIESSVAPDPTSLTIPSLNITAPFEPLGFNPDHSIEVPKNNFGVGWFIYGAKPGEVGAAVVVGHLDSVSGPAIFQNLNKIKQGDKILITRADGSVVTYQVDSMSTFSQDNFPTLAVYGAISYAGIRLITCSGVWDENAGHYSDNLVVFGRKI
jgi:LPXTG-site transpeptidase (sortase) family protein